MRRKTLLPRENLERRFQDIGFDFAALDGVPYWTEDAYYSFSLAEVENDLETPAEDLAALCQEIVGNVVRSEALLNRLRIPENVWDLIATSWRRGDPSLYGRFDFCYNGEGPAKLLEFNADTPTSLFESAVVQWFWRRDHIESGALPSNVDQFNSLHEKLIARWASMTTKPLHLAGFWTMRKTRAR